MISVVIPVYNVEKYLAQCINSVLNQTYTNLEIILVDDGSTDNSGIICDEFAKIYPNIKVIHKGNEGLGYARNSGLEIVSGEYVYFLDSDDYLEPGHLLCVYNTVVSNNADACYTGYQAVDDYGNVISVKKYENKIHKGKEVINDFAVSMLGSSPNKHDSIEYSAAQMYSMAIIREHNIRFPSERELISEDLIFNLNFFQHANSVCIISEVGYFYRVNPNSLSRKYREDRFECSKKFYLYVSEYIKKHNYPDEAAIRVGKSMLLSINSAIAQEVCGSSPHTKKDIKNIVHLICSDDMTKEVIRTYPVNELGIRQRIFIYLVKAEQIFVLGFLTRMHEKTKKSAWKRL